MCPWTSLALVRDEKESHLTFLEASVEGRSCDLSSREEPRNSERLKNIANYVEGLSD